MAEELGMDKAEIRLLNANYEGEVTGQGLHYKTCGAIPALKKVLEKSNYKDISEAPKEGRFKRGIGLANGFKCY